MSSTTRTLSIYVWLSVIVASSVLAVCVAAAILGRQRADDPTAYFYEVFDVGHPGIVGALASIGFMSTAAISLVLALTLASRPWMITGALFTVLAADNLLRLHNQIPAGDVLFRVGYWSVIIWLIPHLSRQRRPAQGMFMLVIGLSLVALSELLDLLSRGGNISDVVEESAACLGAWCLALAMAGIAASLLSERSGSATDERGLR